MQALCDAEIPVSVNVAPIIPGLNDHEIPQILATAADHGASSAGYTCVRLPHGVKDVFAHWLQRHVPAQQEKILGRIREMRGGQLNDSSFGQRMRGQGQVAEDIRKLFRLSARRYGLDRPQAPLSTSAFIPPQGSQMELF
jgi:DNA repair photolyase